MNIGIDIDGTLTEPYDFIPVFNKILNKHVTEDDFINNYDINKIYGITDDDWENITNDEGKTIKDLFLETCRMRKDAPFVIQTLQGDHNCMCITARNRSECQEITRKFLTDNNLSWLKVRYLNSHDKLEAAKQYNIDIMIEDNPEVINELAKNGITVIAIGCNWNKNTKGENIYRVETWREAGITLMMLLTVNKFGGIRKDLKDKYTDRYRSH